MRNIVILTAALFAAACDAPETQPVEETQGDDVIVEENTMAPGDDDMAMAAPVPTGAYIAQAANSDMYEIQAGELAAKNGQSQQVKEFGRMMVEDHTRSSQDMKALVAKGSYSVPVPMRLDPEHQGMLDRLKQAKGAAFDREYMAQQITAHRKALALHQGYAQSGEDADLKAFAAKVTPVVQQHHDWLNRNGGGTTTMAPGAAMGGTRPSGSTSGPMNDAPGSTGSGITGSTGGNRTGSTGPSTTGSTGG